MSLVRGQFILKIACPDAMGIVAQVAGHLTKLRCFIEESAHFGDPATSRFFMRTVFTPHGEFSRSLFTAGFEPIAKAFTMQWELHDTNILPRVLILVSRFDHCLNDLLFRYRKGDLTMAVPAVVSNHMDLAGLVEWHKIPYIHIPVTTATRAAAETRLREIIADTKVDLVVLARYMQVLSDGLCAELAGKAINIHHSFLPSFRGAKPYHQAFERGVKLIGATAHYVTAALDEGPIIEQMVERVDHSQSADQLVAIGRDVESQTLARAVKYHINQRVFLNGHKTVVLRG